VFAAAEQALAHFDVLDILVNNARGLCSVFGARCSVFEVVAGMR
jgi:hypothetical protein